jgi:hypothetical protein
LGGRRGGRERRFRRTIVALVAVGWVEQSETHHGAADEKQWVSQVLNPSYGLNCVQKSASTQVFPFLNCRSYEVFLENRESVSGAEVRNLPQVKFSKGSEMAMEIYVLSDRVLDSMIEWQRAIDAEKFPTSVRLFNGTTVALLSGLLPARYGSGNSGFECDHWAVQSIFDDYPAALDRPWRYALAFRFGSRPGELESAWMAATAYARATGGVIFDTEEARVFQPDDAAALVHHIIQNRSRIDVEALQSEILHRVRGDS